MSSNRRQEQFSKNVQVTGESSKQGGSNRKVKEVVTSIVEERKSYKGAPEKIASTTKISSGTVAAAPETAAKSNQRLLTQK